MLRPHVEWRHPVRSAVALYSSKWFALGMLVATGAWGFHVAAMALAPLSIVQTVISGGLVLLTVLAERYFGFSVGRRQYVGVGLMAIGLILLTLTLPHTGGAHSHYSRVAMVASSPDCSSSAPCSCCPQVRGPSRAPRPLPRLRLGILFGVSDVAIKALTGAVGTRVPSAVLALARGRAHRLDRRLLLLGPRPAGRRGGAGHHAHQRGRQRLGHRRRDHRLRRPDGANPLGIVLQSLAFVLVIAAAAVMPAPMRAAEAVAAGAATAA